MNPTQFDWSIVIQLVVLALPLAGIVAVVTMVLRRRQRYSDLPVDAPTGCFTSRLTETLVIAAACAVLTIFALTCTHWRTLLMVGPADAQSYRVLGIAATGLAVCGLLAALALAWRGASSVAVVALIITVFGYGGAAVWANHRYARDVDLSPSCTDVDLTLDISGCNVVGAALRANGVELGKTPVRIKLSQFLEKVPIWEKAPGPEWPRGEGDDSKRSTPKDKHWGLWRVPAAKHLFLRGPLAEALDERQDRYAYFQAEFDGELAEGTGGSGGGGGSGNYEVGIGFRFPRREAAIEELLNQARLADYTVDEAWLRQAADFGPDAWIAIRRATPLEPQMQKVCDAWANWLFQADEADDARSAWQAFERISTAADDEGKYITDSPAGRAIELVATRLDPRQLTATAEPLIESITSITFSQGTGPTGDTTLAVYDNDTRHERDSLGSNSRSTSVASGGRVDRLMPSGLALAHAIWLCQRQMTESVSGDRDDVFQQHLAPQLLRADAERHAPQALRLAMMLGGDQVDKYLIRQANWTADSTWPAETNSFDWLGGRYVNRWFIAAAQLAGPAGQRFRARNLERLFAAADEATENMLFSGSVTRALPFLFLENDRGTKSTAMLYWPRFRRVAQQVDLYDALKWQVEYLIAMEPASTVGMYRDVFTAAGGDGDFRHASDQVRQLDLLKQLPEEKQIAILDALLEHDAVKPRPGRVAGDHLLRNLQEQRFLQQDDPLAVDYQMKWLRDELPQEEQPGLNRSWLIKRLPKSANRHPNLIAALAAASEPDLRLIAVSAIRAMPTPWNQQLLRDLLDDEDAEVRQAAIAAEAYWAKLRSSAPGESPAAAGGSDSDAD